MEMLLPASTCTTMRSVPSMVGDPLRKMTTVLLTVVFWKRMSLLHPVAVTSAADVMNASGKPDWARDFDNKTEAKRAAEGTGRDPDWRKDFEQPNEKKPEKPKDPPAGGKKPDWMKDFE